MSISNGTHAATTHVDELPAGHGGMARSLDALRLAAAAIAAHASKEIPDVATSTAV